MIWQKNLKIAIIGKISFLLFVPLLFFTSTIFLQSVSAQDCTSLSGNDKLDCLKAQIAEVEKQLSQTTAKKVTLQNEINYQNNQIRLTELKIQETQQQIEDLGTQIDRLENSLVDLSQVFAKRAVETYKLKRLGDSFALLLTANSATEFISRFNYLQRIQQNDRELLLNMQTSQTNYESQKTKMEALQKQLESQKSALASQKAQKQQLLEVTKNDEKNFQRLLAQAKAQLAAFRSFVASQGGASILHGQTKCDGWGCYYNQRDDQWGNMTLGSSSYSVAGYGCLVSSVAMLASHYGKNIKPNDIASQDSAFFYGDLSHSFSVNGVNVSISVASRDRLDELLSSGPVIAGLYSGPAHFIVILRKDGDNYIMNDPFIENGANRPLSDKYSVSDITSLRIVNF